LPPLKRRVIIVIKMDEAGLVADAQHGDLDAFNRLVIAYQSPVFSVAYRILGEEAPASDATQEAFLSAFRNLRGYRGGSFRAWLFRIVTNACYDELRRRKRKPTLPLDDLVEDPEGPEPEAAEQLAASEPGPEARALEGELAEALQDCLRRLPDEFRIVAVLADVEGYDYREVSELVGKPLGTVKSRLARARARLRDCLQRYQELLPAAFRLNEETAR
jgi:RNA polymerase sigma-70 factor (ECF subfamily)